jgi:hypothetical protein
MATMQEWLNREEEGKKLHHSGSFEKLPWRGEVPIRKKTLLLPETEAACNVEAPSPTSHTISEASMRANSITMNRDITAARQVSWERGTKFYLPPVSGYFYYELEPPRCVCLSPHAQCLEHDRHSTNES